MRLHIKVDLPSQEARKQIIQKILDDEPMDGEVDIDQIAKDTEGMSGSDLHELCKLAAQHAMCGAAACDDHATEDVSINKANFDDAIDDIV